MIPSRILLRTATIGLAATAAAAGALVAGPLSSAGAASIGTLSVTPANGNDGTVISLTSSAKCTNPAATNLQATITGSGFPAKGQIVVGNSPTSAYQTDGASGGYVVPLSQTLKDFAAQQNPPATLSGKYTFTLTCRKSAGVDTYGDFTGAIWFTNAHTYQSTDPGPSASDQKLVLRTVSNKSIGGGKGQVILQATATPANSGTSVTFYRRSGMTGKVVPAGNSPVVNGVASRTITGQSGAIQLIYSVLQPKPGFKQVRSGDTSYKIK